METIEKSIEIDAPLRVVYNQWTQFEDFPKFMEGVKEVIQMGDKRLHWKAEIAGREKTWDAEIFEQIPDRRIAWRSISGTMNTGMVNFFPVDSERTRVFLKLNYEPEGAVENMADALGLVSQRVEADLKRFKNFMEARGIATGGWRGEIHGREVLPEGSPQPPRSAPRSSAPRSKRIHSPIDD
jgi:uncharacterized membrane protein